MSGFGTMYRVTCLVLAVIGGNYGSTQGSGTPLGVPNLGWIQDIKQIWYRVLEFRILGILMVLHMRVNGRIWLGQGGLWF